MSYLEIFGVLIGVGVDISKIFGVGAGAGVLKREAGAESESEKCDSAHLCCAARDAFREFSNDQHLRYLVYSPV